MVLIYIDEGGINQSSNNGFYKDGPYIVWSGIFVPQGKYFHLERLFYDLAKNILGVKDWQKKELHATDIWHRTGDFSKITEAKSKKYFEELLQLIGKMNLKIIFSLHQKNKSLRSEISKKEELRKSIYAFLHGIEYSLSELNETGVLIADRSEEGDYTEMQTLLLDRTRWRNLGINRFKLRTKYMYESKSCFILDQVNYSDSKKSLFIQLEDSICFVMQRVFTYLYLKQFPKKGIVANIDLVPVSPDNFKFFFNWSKPLLTYWNNKIRDINLISFADNSLFVDSEFLNINLNDLTPYK